MEGIRNSGRVQKDNQPIKTEETAESCTSLVDEKTRALWLISKNLRCHIARLGTHLILVNNYFVFINDILILRVCKANGKLWWDCISSNFLTAKFQKITIKVSISLPSLALMVCAHVLVFTQSDLEFLTSMSWSSSIIISRVLNSENPRSFRTSYNCYCQRVSVFVRRRILY